MFQPGAPTWSGVGAPYGATQTYKQAGDYDFNGQRKKQLSAFQLIVGIMLPFLLFAAVMFIMSFDIRYNSPDVAMSLSLCCILFSLGLGFNAHSAWKSRMPSASWQFFLFVTSLLACVVGWIAGGANFDDNIEPFHDTQNLATYNSVDPRVFKGQQFMDMGKATFSAGTHLDISKSLGFRNGDVYCVAPIVSGNTTMPRYDFWAVGVNCCSGHVADFACGEYNNPRARSGLRLMRDDIRAYFRLAVQEAEAAYHITTVHPVFMQWMQDPQAEIDAFSETGFKTYIKFVQSYFFVQLMLVFCFWIFVTKR